MDETASPKNGFLHLLAPNFKSLSYWLQVFAVALVYIVAAKIGLSFATVNENVSPIWPPSGVAIASVLIFGIRVWPGVLLGALLANYFTSIAGLTAEAIAIGNTAETLTAAALLRYVRFNKSLERAGDVFKFVLVVLLCTIVSATIGNLSLCLAGSEPRDQFPLLWATWWLGDVAGAVIVAPLLLVWVNKSFPWSAPRTVEGVFLITLIALGSMLNFGNTTPIPIRYQPLTRLIIPFLIWAAFRLGTRGVTLAIFAQSVFAVWGTVKGFGPFYSTIPNQSLLTLQLYITTNAVTFLALVAVVEERRVAQANRLEHQRRLSGNLAITQILAESPKLSEATRRILSTVGQTLNWETGALWIVDKTTETLRLRDLWHAPDVTIDNFEAASREQKFTPGVGLPGRVWQSQQPVWIADIASDNNFPRAHFALADGLRSAFGFPIIADDELLGVGEFFSRETREPDEAVLAMFRSIGIQIGQFIKRQRAEESLRYKEAELAQIADTTPIMLIRCSSDMKYVFVNRAYAELVEKRPDEIVGKQIVEVLGERGLEVIRPYIEKVLDGEIVEYEERIIFKEIGPRFLRTIYRPELNKSGKVVGWLASIADITDRKNAEQALQDSERALVEFFNNATEAIHWMSPEGEIFRANEAELRMMGYPAEAYIGRNVMEFHVDRSNIDELLARLKAGETVENFRSRLRHKSGTVLEVTLSASGYFVDGQFIHSRCFTRDITEQLRAERAVRQLAAIVESTEDAIIGLDLEGRIRSWNAGAERLYQYTADEMVGEPVSRLIPPGRSTDESQLLSQLHTGLRVEHYETVRLARDGSLIDVSLTVSPIKDAAGVVVGASKIARNISDRKRLDQERESLLKREHEARAEAEIANRVKDEFLATLSHELRSPLNAIVGWATMLRKDQLRPEEIRRAVEIIDRNARLQTRLIDSVLDVSRIVSGKFQIDSHPVNLNEVLEAAVDSMKPTADQREITLVRNFDSNGPPVSGDSSRLQQVFWNLLSNAVKFSPKGSTITVELHYSSSAEIIVRDQGRGIDPDFLPHVFDRFRQADSSTTRRYGGLGLGLAIVRHLVEIHGGTVTAESAGPNQGAVFTVYLPLLSEAAIVDRDVEGFGLTTIELASAKQILRGVRVLVVDDENDARELLEQVLASYGAEVRSAPSASAALGLLAEWQPEILLSDISMPEVDGYSFIAQVRKTYNGIMPAIALTANARLEDRDRALAAGYQSHLTKPVNESQLIFNIAQLVGRRMSQRSSS
jgi:PAS domain S-box-containing protein